MLLHQEHAILYRGEYLLATLKLGDRSGNNFCFSSLFSLSLVSFQSPWCGKYDNQTHYPGF